VLRLLADPDRDVRRAAVAALGSVAAPRPAVLAALVARLRDRNEDVAHAAALVLGQQGAAAAKAAPALAALLAHAKATVAVAAAEALVKLGPGARAAGDRMKRALRDPRTRVRLAAAQALVATTADTAAGIAALAEGVGLQRSTDADAEGNPYNNPRREAGYLRADAARRLAALADRPELDAALPALARALADADRDTATAAAQALARLGTRAAPVLPAMIQAAGVHVEQSGYYGAMHAPLCQALAQHAAAAAPALPALIEIFAVSGHCGDAIAAIAKAEPADAVARLRRRFADECGGRYGRADPVLRALGAE
jgi:hypothetical protein